MGMAAVGRRLQAAAVGADVLNARIKATCGRKSLQALELGADVVAEQGCRGGHWQAMHRCRLRPTDGPTLEGAHRDVHLHLVQTSGVSPLQVVQARWVHGVLRGGQGQAGSWAVAHGVATAPGAGPLHMALAAA